MFIKVLFEYFVKNRLFLIILYCVCGSIGSNGTTNPGAGTAFLNPPYSLALYEFGNVQFVNSIMANQPAVSSTF